MPLKTRISDDMKAAMRAKEAPRLSAIRLLLSAMKQKEVDERVELSDADIVTIIDKMIKQRRESIAQFEKGGRQDLADTERFEIGVLQAYMPQALSETEVAAQIGDAIEATGAKAMADMGKVMALLKPKLAGKADMAKVSALVKARLAVKYSSSGADRTVPDHPGAGPWCHGRGIRSSGPDHRPDGCDQKHPPERPHRRG